MADENKLSGEEIEQLADLLRRTRPVQVVAVMLDGTERKLASPQGRGARWTILAKLVATFAEDIDRVELRDKGGAVLGTWTPMRHEAEPETAMPALVDERLTFAVSTQKLIQTAVDHAVDRHTKAMGPLIDGLVQLVRAQDQRLATLERGYITSMRFAHQQFMGRLQAEADASASEADDPFKTLGEGLAAFGQLQQSGMVPGGNGAPKP